MEEEKYPYTIKFGQEVKDYIRYVSEKTGLDEREVVLQIFGWYRYSFEKQEEGYRAEFVKKVRRRSLLGFLISEQESIIPELLGKVSTLDELIGEIETPDENS